MTAISRPTTSRGMIVPGRKSRQARLCARPAHAAPCAGLFLAPAVRPVGRHRVAFSGDTLSVIMPGLNKNPCAQLHFARKPPDLPGPDLHGYVSRYAAIARAASRA